MKEAVMKVIDMLTQEDFHGAFEKLLELYNKCIAAGGDYFKGDESFMCILSIKVLIRKKSGNLFNDPRISKYFHVILVNISDKMKCQCYFHFCVIYTAIYSLHSVFSFMTLRKLITGHVFGVCCIFVFSLKQ